MRGSEGASRLERTDRVARIVLALLLAWAASRGLYGQETRDDPPPPPAGSVRLSDVSDGALLFKTSAPGLYVPAPSLDTSVSIQVSGIVARAEVTQRFVNRTGSCVEGIYVFPLPEGAAVDRLRMAVGGRIIEAEVREREEAKKVYEAAKTEGRKASLVEQERPNVFTTSVASIGDGEEVSVALVYQETLRYDQGKFHLRFPTVVAPRYIPGSIVLAGNSKSSEGVGETSSSSQTVKALGAGGTGWAPDTDQVPDASRVTPPVYAPSDSRRNPVRLRLFVDAGVPIRKMTSGTHALAAAPEGSGYTVALSGEDVVADRDLDVSWELDLGREPKTALFTQTLDGQTYALLMVVPPAAEVLPGTRLPRETVFIVDTSGSMHGTSIDGARRALGFALDRLAPEDRFNVIEFNSVTNALWPESRRALPDAVGEARRWVAKLEARGGTEMLPALRAALEHQGPESEGFVRQVLFMTDGAVGNEEELFRYIREHLAASRLFTVGLGSAPNSHFMTKAAEFGRGTFTYVANASEVQTKMSDLFAKLEAPVLTNLEVRWDDANAETWPAKVPDLYAGEPVVVAARLSTPGGAVTVRGERAGHEWSSRVPLSSSVSGAHEREGVDRLWARRKIAALMDRLTESPSDRDRVRAEVLSVALAHHLVSDFTSLVAVDVTPTALRGEACVPRPIPVHLPAGWSYEHVFGELPQGGTSGRLLLLAGAAAIVAGLLLRRLS
jgi:Ca-activated chloride channel family protein